jgi:predicted phage tail protein
MTTIILHGPLKDLYPNEIRVFANSAAEAIQSLELIPALQRKDGQRHLVRVEGFDSVDALYDRREIDVLHIHPVMDGGGGKGGLGQVILGSVLVVVGIFTAQPYLIQMGASLILGGVLQMLAPQPSINSSNEERSKYLGNGRNTVAIGTRIQMIYGRRKAYGHYISFDIDASVFNTAPAEWYSSPFTNNGELTYSAAPVDLPLEVPAIVYSQPESIFRGMSYSEDMLSEQETFVNFDTVPLVAGEYDLNFSTGQTMRILIEYTGSVDRAIVLGMSRNNPPITGTSIIFTQNYE